MKYPTLQPNIHFLVLLPTCSVVGYIRCLPLLTKQVQPTFQSSRKTSIFKNTARFRKIIIFGYMLR